MISHVSSRPNWYSTHAVCNKRFFFFFFSKNCYYFSDLETQWLRNPELKSTLSSTVIRGVKSQYWRKISLSSVSELYITKWVRHLYVTVTTFMNSHNSLIWLLKLLSTRRKIEPHGDRLYHINKEVKIKLCCCEVEGPSAHKTGFPSFFFFSWSNTTFFF